MTEDLKQAAQQALEALDEIHAGKRHPQLALAVAHNLRRALNQRPAAQTWDKNADVCKGAWELGTACGTCAKCIATKPAQRPAAQEGEVLKCTMTHTPVWKPGSFGLPYQESNFACKTCGYVGNHDKHPGCKRASLPAPQQATPEPECARSHPHENMSATCELRTEIARLRNETTRLKAATPEPVGEPVGTVECYQIRGEDVVLGYLPRPLPVGTKLYTRPAPGVTETDADALLDFMEAHRVSVTPEYEGQWCARQYDDEPQAVAEFEAATPRDAIRALAAAQAKGAGHA